MKTLLVTVTILFLSTSDLFGQRLSKADLLGDLEFVYQHLKESVSYRTQKNKHKQVESTYQELKENASDSYYTLDACRALHRLVDVVLDFHNAVFSSNAAFSFNDLKDSLNAEAVLAQTKGFFPFSTVDLDRLRLKLSNSSADAVGALRAYSYFWLARVYQKSYAINPEAPAVPIYTQSADKETYGNPRSSLKDVYQLITADIDFALAHISEHREGKYVVNKHVVSAFAAMIYQELAMQDASLWDTVIKNAQDATQGYPLMSNAEYLAGFNSIDNQEWIWGLPVPSDQSLTYYSIYSFLDQENGYYKNL